jgi:protein-tyrosine phosphatase
MGDNSPPPESYSIESPAPVQKISKPKLKDIQSMSTNLDVQLAKANRRKSKGYANPFKMCVSLSKRRFMEDGYNLDLAYVTPNIVAMAYPAAGLEGYYRNSLDSVKQFFKERHHDKYKVFNLCIESARNYPKNTFKNYSYIPFFDHNSPSIQDIHNFCEDASRFLAADPKNIVAVHCKAGKSRTGVMVCCLLLHLGIFDEAQVALEYYNLRRTKDGVGVNIPSQVRYIHYWCKFLSEGMSLGGLDQRLWVFKKVAISTVGWAGHDASNLNLSIEKDTHQMLSIFDTAVNGIINLTTQSVSWHDE